MIPKKIHYCWFGGKPLPAQAKICIASWKKYLPDFEIIEWNESNFDVSIIPYVKEAYEKKKYAFVSDYARFWILYHHGGLYFDTDVEIIRPLDDIISAGAFMGFENNSITTQKRIPNMGIGVNPGLGLGVSAGHFFYNEILGYYAKEHFVTHDNSLNLNTVGVRVTSIMKEHGLMINNQFQRVCDINIYPPDYFSPISIVDGKLWITENTVSIHHYAASWTTPSYRIIRKFILWIGGYRLKSFISRILR